MLILMFYLGEVMYAIRCQKVREVAPMVKLKPLPDTPAFFAGFFNYRGAIVPVVDLYQLIHQKPCNMRLSTRIILIDYVTDNQTPGIMGILAERVTEAIMKPVDALIPISGAVQQSPYLEGIIMNENEMIYTIDVEKLPSRLPYLPIMTQVPE